MTWKRFFIGAGLVLIAAIGAACWLLPRYAFPWLTAEIQKRSGYELTAQSVGFHIRRGLSLTGLVLRDPQGKEIFSARRFYLDPHWGSLLQKRLEITQVAMDLDGGTVTGKGKINFDQGIRYQLKLGTHRYVVQAASVPAVIVTGEVNASGDLKAPLEVTLAGYADIREKAAPSRRAGRVRVDVVKGRGQVTARLSAPLTAVATAQVDLARQHVDLVFQTGAFSPDPAKPQPWDLQTADGRVAGTPQRLKVTAQAHFRSSAAVRYAGTVRKTAGETRIDWREIVFHPSSGADWRTLQPGHARVDSHKVLHIPELGLSDGSSRIELTRLQYATGYLEGRLRADLLLALLPNLVPELEMDKQNHLVADVTARGRYPDIELHGRIATEIPQLKYDPAGVEIKEFKAELESQGPLWRVNVFRGKLGKGTFEVTGQAWPQMDLKLAAHKVTLNIPKQLDLQTEAYLRLAGTARAPEFTGIIAPEKGTYIQEHKKDKKGEAKPAENAPPAKPNAFWRALKVEVKAVWTHRLWYRDGLSKIETSGDLRLQKDPGAEVASLSGPVNLVRGSYDAIGRDFVIDSGEIVFTGEKEVNPRLNIRAEYRTEDVRVNLLVLGTAKHPDLRFTSIPPLSRQEILSVLATGKPSGKPGEDKGSQEVAADVASTYLTRTLRESGLNMGLDVVRVTPTPTGTMWTVGRYLGPDLFVSYGQNPKDAATSVVNAEYYLTRRWSISTQASSANDNYVDFLFRYPLERRKAGRKP